MKNLLSIIVIVCAIALSGCTSWPKDSLIRDGKVTTVWGTVSVGAAATGEAAKSLSAQERAALLAPKKP